MQIRCLLALLKQTPISLQTRADTPTISFFLGTPSHQYAVNVWFKHVHVDFGYKCTHCSGLSWTPTIALLNSVIHCVFECGLSPHCAWSSACHWNNLCCNTMGNKEVTWRFVFLVFTGNADDCGGRGYCWGPKQCVGGWHVSSRTQGFPGFWVNPSNCFEGLQALLQILKIG